MLKNFGSSDDLWFNVLITRHLGEQTPNLAHDAPSIKYRLVDATEHLLNF